MAGSINKVILVGNVGRDPEIRTTQNGKEIALFSVATSKNWKDSNTGENTSRTEWHRIVVFSEPLINLTKNYINRGSKLYIEGELQTRKWTDANGQERYSTEIVLQGFNATITLLDSRSNEGNNNTGQGQRSEEGFDSSSLGSSPSRAATSNKTNFVHDELDDEIPF